LRETEVAQYNKEYWNLNQLHGLSQIHEEIKGDIGSFVKLYRLSKTAGMNAQHVVNVLKIANNHLPAVESRCENLKREASLQAGNQNSARTFQELSDHISATRNTWSNMRYLVNNED